LFCRELKYAMVCDNFESTVSIAAPAIPCEIDAELTGLGGDMADHLKNSIKVPQKQSGGNQILDNLFTKNPGKRI
jgi:hypothetical protein